MMIAIAAFIFNFMSNILLLYLMSKIFPCRINAWKTALVAWGLSMFVLLRYIPGETISNIVDVIALLSIPLYLAIPLLFYGKLWKRFIVLLYFYAMGGLCEIVVSTALSFLSINIADITSWDMIIGVLFTFILYVPLAFLSLAIWKRIEARRFQPFYLLFIVIPISQMVITFYYANTLRIDGVYGVEVIEGILAGVAIYLIAAVILFRYVLTHEKKETLKTQLSDTRRQVELEQTRHKELETRREELAKIRHDFNNQLAGIVQLVKVGEDKAAQGIIAELSEVINRDLGG